MITPKAENKVYMPICEYKDIVLFYLHNFPVSGVPARDLTAAEVEKYGGMEMLLDTGAYAKRRDEE
jgi:hypothetical protein